MNMGSFSVLKSIAILLVLGASSSPTFAQAPGKKLSFDSYRTLQTRNMFDSERQPGVVAAATPQPAVGAPVTQADYVALTGVLITSEKTLAFFSGSRPDYNKVLAVKGKIAGALISKIAESSIEVTRAGKHVTVAVGQTVPLDANSVPAPAPATMAATASPSLTGTSLNSSTNPTSSDREALLRRMMERRQRELR